MGIPIIYADESCLTTKLLPKCEWMVKGKNIEIDESTQTFLVPPVLLFGPGKLLHEVSSDLQFLLVF